MLQEIVFKLSSREHVMRWMSKKNVFFVCFFFLVQKKIHPLTDDVVFI